MAAKHSSKPKLAAVPVEPDTDGAQEDAQATNPLIGTDAEDTMSICSAVVEFLADFHLRRSDCEQRREIELGEFHVLRVVASALSIQAHVLEEVANG